MTEKLQRMKKQQLNAEMFAELRDWDQQSFRERLERLNFLHGLTTPPEKGWSVPGGLIGFAAFWEAERCFIGGNFVSTVMLIQTFVEHSLADILARLKYRVRRLSFQRLIDKALNMGELTPSLAKQLHKLRQLRNPYAHPNMDVWPTPYFKRVMSDAGGNSYALHEADARYAIRVAASYIRQIANRWDPLLQANHEYKDPLHAMTIDGDKYPITDFWIFRK